MSRLWPARGSENQRLLEEIGCSVFRSGTPERVALAPFPCGTCCAELQSLYRETPAPGPSGNNSCSGCLRICHEKTSPVRRAGARQQGIVGRSVAICDRSPAEPGDRGSAYGPELLRIANHRLGLLLRPAARDADGVCERAARGRPAALPQFDRRRHCGGHHDVTRNGWRSWCGAARSSSRVT